MLNAPIGDVYIAVLFTSSNWVEKEKKPNFQIL
jgi:hypothetical protein